METLESEAESGSSPPSAVGGAGVPVHLQGSPGREAVRTGAERAVAGRAGHLPVVAGGTHIAVVSGGVVAAVLGPHVSKGEENNGKLLELILIWQ